MQQFLSSLSPIASAAIARGNIPVEMSVSINDMSVSYAHAHAHDALLRETLGS